MLYVKLGNMSVALNKRWNIIIFIVYFRLLQISKRSGLESFDSWCSIQNLPNLFKNAKTRTDTQSYITARWLCLERRHCEAFMLNTQKKRLCNSGGGGGGGGGSCSSTAITYILVEFKQQESMKSEILTQDWMDLWYNHNNYNFQWNSLTLFCITLISCQNETSIATVS